MSSIRKDLEPQGYSIGFQYFREGCCLLNRNTLIVSAMEQENGGSNLFCVIARRANPESFR